MAHTIQNRLPSTFVISLGFPFPSSIWDTSLLFWEIRVRLLKNTIHDSGSANLLSPTGAKNSINVRCSSTFVKYHHALSHCTGEGNLHPTRFGSPWSLWGYLGFIFPVPENKSHRPSRAMYYHVKLTQKLSEMRRSLVQVRLFSMPHQQTQPRQSRDITPAITTPTSVFHKENPTALATGTWWATASSLPQMEADLQTGNQTAPSSERLRPHLNPYGDQWQIFNDGLQSTTGWGCSSFLDSQHPH